MIPKSISASSLDTAAACLARYKATSLDRGAGFANPAASLGSTLHLTLEWFVEPITLGFKEWDYKVLMELYDKAFFEIFGHMRKDEWYEDGKQILTGWFNRRDQASDLFDVEIISREVKKSFDVPHRNALGVIEHVIPFNYIIDRLDRTDTDCYRVVDYKSQRSPYSASELHNKIQPRAYALAIQIEYPNAKEIWVEMDFLRYNRVSARFTRDDNIETWNHIRQQLAVIINTPSENPPETLNEGCRYCPRKLVCHALQSNLRIGGVLSFSVDQLAEKYFELKSQQDGIKAGLDEIEGTLLAHAAANDELEWTGPGYSAKVTARKTRVIDNAQLARIIGPELMSEYGHVNVSDLDSLRKDPRLTPAQASLLNTAVSTKTSDPGIRITRKIDTAP